MSSWQGYTSPWHTLTVTEVVHYHYDNECPGHDHGLPDTAPEIDWDLTHPEECAVNSDRCCCRYEDPAKFTFLKTEERCPDCAADNHENCYRCYPRCDVEMDVGECWNELGLPTTVGVYRVRIANAGRDYWGEYDYDFEIEEIKDSVHN